MRKLLPLLLLFLSYTATSQIVNIPDPNFKNALLAATFPVIDINNDGEIQVSEAAAVNFLNVSHKNINNLTGISTFTNLDTLWCFSNNLTTLNLSALTNLNELDCSFNNLTNLNISGLSYLKNVNCSYNALNTINVNGLDSLTSLRGMENNLTSLTLNNLDNIFLVNVNNNEITAVNVSNCPTLQHLYMDDNKLTNADFQGVNNLIKLYLADNLLTSINVSGLSSLTDLQLQNNQLTNLNLNGLADLTSLFVWDNSLTSIDISGSPEIDYLQAANNQLIYVNLKNGPMYLAHLNLQGNPNIEFICADEPEINAIRTFLTQNGQPNILYSSYCNFTPGGTFNTITGKLRTDLNNNGCDSTDHPASDIIIEISDGTSSGYTTTDSAGEYNFYTAAGNFIITPRPQPYYTLTPFADTIIFTGTDSIYRNNFCLSANSVHKDLDIIIIPTSAARPGFDATYRVIYKNKGTVTLSGSVGMGYKSEKTTFLTSDPVPTTHTTDSLSWSYVNLKPFETRHIDVSYNILPPPVNNNAEELLFTSSITPLTDEETPPDNTFSLEQILTGSFDPNDKTCLEGKSIDITNKDKYVHYVIRFQNMGTDTAFNVVVKDTLSSKFQWNSIEVTNTSHLYQLKQSGNKQEFHFKGINLPAKSVDEPGSNGFIAFKIKAATSVLNGDSLINKAAIYFDYNLPVITNNAITVFDSIRIIPITMEYFTGYNHQNKNSLNWKAICMSFKAKFDIQRSADSINFEDIFTLTASKIRCMQPFEFNDNSPFVGMNYYRIRITNVDGSITFSNVISIKNEQISLQIATVQPNPITDGKATITIFSKEAQTVNIIVTDLQGKTMQIFNQSLSIGNNKVDLNLTNLAVGMYTINIRSVTGSYESLRVLVQ